MPVRGGGSTFERRFRRTKLFTRPSTMPIRSRLGAPDLTPLETAAAADLKATRTPTGGLAVVVPNGDGGPLVLELRQVGTDTVDKLKLVFLVLQWVLCSDWPFRLNPADLPPGLIVIVKEVLAQYGWELNPKNSAPIFAQAAVDGAAVQLPHRDGKSEGRKIGIKFGGAIHFWATKQ